MKKSLGFGEVMGTHWVAKIMSNGMFDEDKVTKGKEM